MLQTSRLLKLADLLEADAANPQGMRFDIGWWGTRTDAGPYDILTAIPVDCGTVGCAIGLACISGVFKEEGFDFNPTAKRRDGNNIIPTYGHLRNFDAVNAFFEMSDDLSKRLFYHSYYPEDLRRGAEAERAVAARIRQAVTSNEATYQAQSK